MDTNKIAAGLRLIADGLTEEAPFANPALQPAMNPAPQSGVNPAPQPVANSALQNVVPLPGAMPEPPATPAASPTQTGFPPFNAQTPQLDPSELKARMQRLSQTHGNQVIVGLLQRGGYSKFSDIPPQNYVHLDQALRALEESAHG